MDCLNETDLLVLLEGPAPEAWHDHLDVCEDCAQAVAAMARVRGGESGFFEAGKSPPRERAVPELAWRYSMRGEYARGGQARILLAHDESIGREVVIKELLAPGGGEENDEGSAPASPPLPRESVARFLREARITGQLSHPGIVPVHEIGLHADGTPYYSMQLVRGRTLAHAIRMARTLAERLRLLEHFVRLCQAVSFAHSRGVIHRDIKPQNTMVGEFGETVLLDWGLAKVRGCADETAIARRLHADLELGSVATVDGTAVGTPSYMSPEQAQGLIGDIDERSDVFGLGAVLYEILTGQPPYSSRATPEQFDRIRRGVIKPVTEVCPLAPPELVTIGAKAMAPNRADRYQRVAELTEEVSAFLTGGRVGSYGYSRWELCKRVVSQHRAAAMAGLVTAAVVLVALIVVSAALRRESVQRLRAERRAAEVLEQGAASALAKGKLLEARASLRGAFELRDTASARALWWELSGRPLLWSKKLASSIGLARAPDGSTLAVAGNGLLQLIDTRTTATRSIALPLPEIRPKFISFSADSRRVAVGGKDGAVVCELATSTCSVWLQGRADPAVFPAYSPDGRYVATGGDSAVTLWDASTLRLVRTLDNPAVKASALAFSLDGRFLAAAHGDVFVWDIVSGKLAAHLRDDHGTSQAGVVAFSPNGRLLATAGGLSQGKAKVRVWTMPAGALAAELGEDQSISPLTLTFCGNDTLAIPADDHSIRLYDIPSRTMRRELVGHDEIVADLVASADGRVLASADVEDVVKLWSLEDQAPPPAAAAVPNTFANVRAAPDGRSFIAWGTDRFARVWGLSSPSPVRILEEAPRPIFTVEYSRDGRRVMGEAAGLLVEWDLASGSLRRWLPIGNASSRNLEINSQSELLATSSDGAEIELWDTNRGEIARRVSGFPGHAVGFWFRPDGEELVVVSDASNILSRYASATGKPLGIVTPDDSVWDVKWDLRGNLLLTLEWGDILNLWSGGTKRRLATFESGTVSLSYSPEREAVAVSLSDGSVQLLSTRGGPVARLRASQSVARGLEFLGGGAYIVTADSKPAVRLWDTRSGRAVWRASMLRRAVPELAMTTGWQHLDGRTQSVAPMHNHEKWRVRVTEALRADESARGSLCLVTESGGLELWDEASDAVVWARDLEPNAAVLDLLAFEDGCLMRLGHEARFYPREGQPQFLGSDASAIADIGDEKLVVLADSLLTIDAAGARGTAAVRVGTSAVARADGYLAVGDTDGRVDLVSRESTLTLRDTPASSVNRILPGVGPTVAVAFRNGAVGLWSTNDGAPLHQTWLNGSVDHLRRLGNTLYAATELGAFVAWDLSLFAMDYCELLRTVWRRAPVLLDGGVPKVAVPNASHRCYVAHD